MGKRILIRLAIFIIAMAVYGVFYFTGNVKESPKNIGKVMVEGEFDITYKGTVSKKYLDILVDGDKFDVKKAHEQDIQKEVDYFFEYFGFDLKEKEARNKEVFTVFDNLYKKAKYKIAKVVENKDGIIAVSLEMEPFAFMEELEGDYNKMIDDYLKEVGVDNIDALSDEQYRTFSKNALDRLIQKSGEEIKYKDPITITVKVPKDSDGLYKVDSDDLSKAIATIVPFGI